MVEIVEEIFFKIYEL